MIKCVIIFICDNPEGSFSVGIVNTSMVRTKLLYYLLLRDLKGVWSIGAGQGGEPSISYQGPSQSG
jgi:hypothetical protein